MESADKIDKYGELSIGTASPCLRLTGKGEDFEILALNEQGRKILTLLKKGFSFCDKATYKKEAIIGKLKPQRKSVEEEQRLKLKTHMDIIRKVAFFFKPVSKPFIPYCGLFGFFAYDFIDQFEDLPLNREDILKEPDYEFYFADNLFIADHKNNKTHFIANVLITDNKKEDVVKRCNKILENYEKLLNEKLPVPRKFKQEKQKSSRSS